MLLFKDGMVSRSTLGMLWVAGESTNAHCTAACCLLQHLGRRGRVLYVCGNPGYRVGPGLKKLREWEHAHLRVWVLAGYKGNEISNTFRSNSFRRYKGRICIHKWFFFFFERQHLIVLPKSILNLEVTSILQVFVHVCEGRSCHRMSSSVALYCIFPDRISPPIWSLLI